MKPTYYFGQPAVRLFPFFLCLSLIGLLPLGGCNSGKEEKSNKKKSGSFLVKPDDVEEDPIEYSLTDDQTKYLWDLEHHANILGKHGFSPLLKAIVKGSKEDIINVIGEPQCSIIADSGESLDYQTELLKLNRSKAPQDKELKSITADSFADWLLAQRAMFTESPAPKARFDVRTILPPNEDEFWAIDCIYRIWGTSKEGGPLEFSAQLKLTTHEIEKSRMDLGSWMNTCEVTQTELSRSKHSLFELIDPKLTRIFPNTFHDNWKSARKEINTGGIYACDYNRDGIADMFVSDKKEDAGKMFTGKPNGKFDDETHFLELMLAKNCRIAAFVDIDNDGWEDVFFPSLPRIYRNVKGEKFVNYTGQTNLPLMLDMAEGKLNRISAIVPADFDLDGDIDLYITRSVENVGSWLQSVQPDLAHNQLLRNDGNWTFTDVTRRTRTDGEGRSAFSAVWTDVNNDLYPDLYVINEFGNGSLLINQKGVKFEKQSLMEGQSDFGSMGLTCGDYDNDGNTDIYVSNMYSKAGSRVMGNMKDGTYPEEVQTRLRSMVAGGELYKNNGDLNFTPVGKDFQIHSAGWAWGSALADLNNDGWLDLYVTAGFISRDREKPDG